MNFTYFPVRQFTQALEQTAKVKARLEPFIGEIECYNMQWTFQIFSELYKYTHAPGVEVTYKFNALVALKVLLNTCEFPVLLCTEVYFLTHIRKVATFQIHLPERQRGLSYFTKLGFPVTQENKKYGYNYVRLASQIISLMSRVKPSRLFRDAQISQPSQFATSLDILKAYQWKDYQQLGFYSDEDEKRLRNRFMNRLQNFTLNSHKYNQFFGCYLDRLLRKQYSPKGIDPRKILQSCQIWACEVVLQNLKQILKEKKASVKTNVIRMITEFVRWGYIKAYYMIENENIFGDLLEMIRYNYSMNTSIRKGVAFRNLEGTQQQRKNLHKQLIRCLQIWAICIPKNPVNLKQQSRSSAIYREFLHQLKISVPEGNFKKLRDQCEFNLEKNKLINHLIMKEMQINFDATKLRRTSSNLQQFFNIGQNYLSLSSFKSFITTQFLAQLQTFTVPQKPYRESEESNNTSSSASKSDSLCISGKLRDKVNFLQPPANTKLTNNKMISTKQLNLRRRKRCQQENFSDEIDEEVDVENKQINKPFFKMQKKGHPKDIKIKNQEKVQFFGGSQFDIESHTSIIMKQTESRNSINININSPVKRKNTNQRQSGQSTIGSTIFENHIKKLLKRNAQLQEALFLKDIEIQILRAKQTYRHQSASSSSWNSASTTPAHRDSVFIPCREDFFKEYLWGLKQLSLKTIFRNKGLLVKTENIEIGFIIESTGEGSAKLQLFITPEHHLKNIQLEIKDPSNVLQQNKKDKLEQIHRLKQKRLLFKCKVNHFPYCLPKISLRYTIDKVEQQHYLLLPVTPNRFITFNNDLKIMNSSVHLQTNTLFAKYSDSNKIQTLIPELKQIKDTENTNIFAGSALMLGSRYNIYLKIDKNKIHLQGQYEVDKQHKERRQQLQFLLVSLLQIFAK